MIDENLLKILCCPKCKGDIKIDESKRHLLCKQCNLLYPIKDGIPVMLIEEAQKYEEKT